MARAPQQDAPIGTVLARHDHADLRADHPALRGAHSPRMTTLLVTFRVGQIGELIPVATAIFCPAPVS